MFVIVFEFIMGLMHSLSAKNCNHLVCYGCHTNFIVDSIGDPPEELQIFLEKK
jgi:hypothetical protein